jgi:hypothetical protein
MKGDKTKSMGVGKFANMPTEVVMKEYPKNGNSMDPHLDDTIKRLDSDSSDTAGKLRRNRPKSMY